MSPVHHSLRFYVKLMVTSIIPTLAFCGQLILVHEGGFAAQQGGDTSDEEAEAEVDIQVLEIAPANWRQLRLRKGPGVRLIDEYTFESWVFGSHTRTPRRVLLEDVLTAQVKKTCEAYHLNAEFQQKLQLAGLVDILRFCEQVDTLRADVCDVPLDLKEVQAVNQGAKRLRIIYEAYPFRVEGCLYSKVLGRILRTERIPPQALHFIDDPAALEVMREVEYYKSLVELIGQRLAAKAPLQNKKQRIQLAEMFRQQLQTEPPFSLRDSKEVIERLSRLPKKPWQSILDQAQWDELAREFTKVRPEFAAENADEATPKPSVNPNMNQ